MKYLKFLFMLLIAKLTCGDDIIQTKSGPVRGKTVASGKVEAFLGIPFAEPPVGPLRFARPVPISPWEDIYDATELPPPCIQLGNTGEIYFTPNSENMTEDCLYLNLWVPRQRCKSKGRPIMLFIYGGSLLTGSTSMSLYDGATLAKQGDVIVVTVNYRLGGLGFFYGLTDEAAGNMGLYDQLAAMRWIKRNAECFHGDPDNIVIMGESSGGFSVSLHQISPMSRNFFNKAILLSGSSLHPLYSNNNDMLLNASQAYANYLGCANETETLANNSKSIVDCMKKLPAKNFSEADLALYIMNLGVNIPRIGDEFIPENSSQAFRLGHFKDTPVLFSAARDEGTLLLSTGYPDIFGFYGHKDVSSSFNETVLKQIMKDVLMTDNETEVEYIFQAYKNLSYGENFEDGNVLRKIISDIIGDFVITCSMIFQADFQSLRDIKPIYFDIFDYRSPSTPHAEWMGVTHFEDLPYIFGNPMHSSNFTKDEKRFSRDVIRMWSSFAKTGNPNIRKGSKPRWPRYTYQDPKYLNLGKNKTVGTGPDDRCEIWRSRFGSVIDDEQ